MGYAEKIRFFPVVKVDFDSQSWVMGMGRPGGREWQQEPMAILWLTSGPAA